jgi:hypothetical protein
MPTHLTDTISSANAEQLEGKWGSAVETSQWPGFGH